MENRVKLSVLGISFSQVQAGAYALILAEENGLRRLPIVIGTPEAQSIALVIENITPPRPLSHDLIHSIFKELNIELVEAFIHKFENGAFIRSCCCGNMVKNIELIRGLPMRWLLPCAHIRLFIPRKRL